MDKVGQKMRAVSYKAKAEVGYEAELFDIPKPGPGQVLIKVEYAVINPSDLYMMNGQYSGTFEYPVTPGSEGSGTVVAYGGGWGAWFLMGKRVGFTRQSEKGGKFSKGGSYAEYVVTNAFQCIALDKKATMQQGACSFVNPVTAIGLLDRCKFYKAKCIIQSGASSQLGRMIIKLFKQHGITVINIVRKDEHIEMLKKEYGADYVMNSTAENFDTELYELATKLGANVGLDAVAGDMPGRMLVCLGKGGTVINYGLLSGEPIGPLNPIVLIFKGQRIESFLLPYWIGSKGLYTQYNALKASKPLISDIVVQKEFGLHQITEAIEFYKANMTGGKIFLNPTILPETETETPKVEEEKN